MITRETILKHINKIFGHDMHAKRVASLAIHAIGNGLAQAKGLERKYAIKQVDRLLSNAKLNLWSLFDDWVCYVVAERKKIVVSLDWTEFDADDHTTIFLSLQTNHGRNPPLLWKTHQKLNLKGKRNEYERELLLKLRLTLPEELEVTIVADRGFSSTPLFAFIEDELKFNYLIRFKGNILLGPPGEKPKLAKDWLTSSGRTRTLTDVELTGQRQPVARVFCCKKAKMKEAWFLASNRRDISATTALAWYGRRWGIECSFRDIKGYKFGMGMGDMHVSSPLCRDRLFLFSALAIVLLTLLGKAGDSVGLEKTIKANISKTRTYSFFRQGCIYYPLLPKMKEENALKLMEKFTYPLSQHPLYRKIFGII